jgi:hypothetical protein
MHVVLTAISNAPSEALTVVVTLVAIVLTGLSLGFAAFGMATINVSVPYIGLANAISLTQQAFLLESKGLRCSPCTRR